MKPIALALAVALATPVAAQAPSQSLDDAIAEAARKAREALAALQGAVEPWLGPLERYLADPGAFLPPEVTPEGDILIRRRPDVTPQPPRSAPPPVDL